MFEAFEFLAAVASLDNLALDDFGPHSPAVLAMPPSSLFGTVPTWGGSSRLD
jgi:hypothetical protein